MARVPMAVGFGGSRKPAMISLNSGSSTAAAASGNVNQRVDRSACSGQLSNWLTTASGKTSTSISRADPSRRRLV
jgi:hypothetical protein